MKKPSLVLNSASNYFLLAVNSVIGFLLTPFLISQLGDAGYGIWVLVVSIVGYYGILDIGIRDATIRYVARSLGKEDYASLNQTVNTSLVLFTIIGLFVACLSFLLARPLAGFFNLGKEQLESFVLLVRLLGLGVAIGFPRRVFGAYLVAIERFVIYNAIHVVSAIIRVSCIFLLLAHGGGLSDIGWIELGTEAFLFTGIPLAVWRVKETKDVRLKISPFLANSRAVIALLRFGFFIFITLLGDLCRMNIDTAIIGRFITMESVGIFGVALTLIRMLERMTHACAYPTSPRLAMLAGKDMIEFRKRYLQYSRYTSIIIMSFTYAALLVAPKFITWWVGEKFNESALIFIILATSLAIDWMTNVSTNALRALNKHHYYALQTIILGFVYLISKLILVGDYGLIGVALGTAIPLFVVKMVIQPIYTCRLIGVRWQDYFTGVILYPLGTAVILGIIFNYFAVFLNGDSFISLAFFGFQCVLVFLTLSLFTCLNSEERGLISYHSTKAYRQLVGRYYS